MRVPGDGGVAVLVGVDVAVGMTDGVGVGVDVAVEGCNAAAGAATQPFSKVNTASATSTSVEGFMRLRTRSVVNPLLKCSINVQARTFMVSADRGSVNGWESGSRGAWDAETSMSGSHESAAKSL